MPGAGAPFRQKREPPHVCVHTWRDDSGEMAFASASRCCQGTLPWTSPYVLADPVFSKYLSTGGMKAPRSISIGGQARASRSWCVCYTEKAPNACTAEEHKIQETPTIYPIDRQPTQLTDQAPSAIESAARRRITPINSSRARLQHSNNPLSSPSTNRVITRSSQPTQPAAKPRSNTQAG